MFVQTIEGLLIDRANVKNVSILDKVISIYNDDINMDKNVTSLKNASRCNQIKFFRYHWSYQPKKFV